MDGFVIILLCRILYMLVCCWWFSFSVWVVVYFVIMCFVGVGLVVIL